MRTGNKEQQVFHKSVTGASHQRKGIPCQDASTSWVSSDRKLKIIVVADGHGDQTCIRSDRGSAIAVSCAMQALRTFGEYYQDAPVLNAVTSEKYAGKRIIRQLTDAILFDWSKQVKEDLRNDPLTEDEYERADIYAEQYINGIHVERAYGATLVAALETEKYILLLQQGDGRCDVLYSDGTMAQPVPEDERCEGNTTTSLSDEDAADGIRVVLISKASCRAAACFVSTDGVDNSFFEDEDLREFYLEVCTRLAGCDTEAWPEYLQAQMEEVTRHGNGDDVSLAGIIDLSAMDLLAKEHLKALEKKRMEEERQQRQDQLQKLRQKREELQHKINDVSPFEQGQIVHEYLQCVILYRELMEQMVPTDVESDRR